MPVLGMQTGIRQGPYPSELPAWQRCSPCTMRERARDKLYLQSQKRLPSSVADGLVFSRKTAGPGGQARWRGQLERTLDNVKQPGMFREL